MALPVFKNAALQALGAQCNVRRLQARCALGRHRPDIQTAVLCAQLLGKGGTALVVYVDHSALQASPIKQTALGVPVGLHAPVVVQVVLREIGEDGQADACGIQAVLLQADGGGLQAAIAQALADKFVQAVLQQNTVRRGQAAAGQGVVSVLTGRRNADA